MLIINKQNKPQKMQTLQTIPTESIFVLATIGTAFVLSVSIVIGYLIEKPLRFVASFFL